MPRNRAVRLALALGAGGLALAAAFQCRALDRERSEVLLLARELGAATPELERSIRRAEDPELARIALARALVVQALEGDPGGEGAAGSSRRRLEEADRLARAALARRPASWEAATLAGAATYLAWSLERDPRLLQEYRRWEEPLLLARRLAPGRPEPGHHLAAAYLELWPALSDAKRELTRELAADALADRRTFGRLIEPWLATTGGDLGPVPDTPWAWGAVQGAMTRRRDWAGYCHAWEAGRRSSRAALAEQLQEAERLLRAGKLLHARGALFGIAASAPADRAFADLVDRALRAAPHGPAAPAERRRLAEWLHWSFDLALGGDPPLSPVALGRLRAAVTGDGAGDARDHAAAAWTHLVAGDLAAAERAERRAEARWAAAWGPYWIEKAGSLAARGDPGAAEALALVHSDWRRHAAYRRARRAAAELAGDRAGAEEARRALEALEARSWSAFEWSWRGGRARLEPLVAGGAGTLVVALAEVPAEGAAAALRWDGETLGCFAVSAAGALTHPLVDPAGLHLLELETLASARGRVWPGPVELR